MSAWIILAVALPLTGLALVLVVRPQAYWRAIVRTGSLREAEQDWMHARIVGLLGLAIGCFVIGAIVTDLLS